MSKKFTVGIWMTVKDSIGKPQGLQIWSIQEGKQDGKGLEWFTVVSVSDEDAALQLGQDIYAGKIPAREHAEKSAEDKVSKEAA